MSLLPVRLAARELRGGLRDFRVFLACLALGVAAIAAVGSTHRAVVAGLEADAQVILGGDVDLSLHHRTVPADQRAHLAASGALSETAAMRAMAHGPEGGRPVLVELKAVDRNYPLYGAVTLEPAMPLSAALAPADGVRGAVADRALAARLGLALGARVSVGETSFELRTWLANEPDRGASAFALGPRLMIGLDGLADTALVQPGSLVQYHYRVRLAPETDGAAWLADLGTRFPRAGWRVRSLDQAAPGLQRLVDRVTIYLTLIGLAALLIGGVGVANATKSYLDGRLATIAILKCLGASDGLVFRVYLCQVLALAALGVAIGLALGAGAAYALAPLLAGELPVAARTGLYPGPLALAAAYGVLVALTFALGPLARTRAVPPGHLFRSVVAPVGGWLGRREIVSIALAACALAALAVAATPDRRLALWFVAGAVAALAAFWSTGRVLADGAALAGRMRALTAGRPTFRLALANLHRPGTPMPAVVLSLGIGLTVLVAIALIEGNLARQIAERMPAWAPAYYFIDIQPDQVAAFDATVRAVDGVGAVERLPHLRGRIARIAGVPLAEVAVAEEVAWITRSDRGITYTGAIPPNTKLAAGRWWLEDYRGPPLVSFDAEAAAGLGVGVGDTLTLNILGREITATIANLRRIEWGTLGLNFVFVFAPGTLEAAPHTHIATAQVAPAAEAALERAVTERFRNVSAIRVRDALETAARILGQIGTAVRATAAVTIVAGVLVLAGAVAAGHRRRVYDAVILKVLGATRRRILTAYLIEYGLLGLATGVVAAALGTAAGWVVLVRVMHTEWTFLPGAVAMTAAAGAVLTLGAGFVATWRALGHKAAPLLRNE